MFKRKGRRPARRQRKGKGKGSGTRINRSRLGLMPSVQNRNYATITETRAEGTISANLPYGQSVSIGMFPRALAMARLFKYYRLSKVVYDYNPDANTYQAGPNATSETIPFMYYTMNRDGALNATTSLAQLQADGARAIKFTKKIVIAYKPNLAQACQLLQIGGNPTTYYNGNNTPVYDKWISSVGLQNGANNFGGQIEPMPSSAGAASVVNVINTVPYYGHSFFIEQDVSPTGSAVVGFITITCQWEFKEPVLYAAGST